MKISVQLYTLRSLMEKDLWGTMESLAKIGFRNVELAGLYGHTPEEWADRLKDLGLTAHSAHFGWNPTDEELESAFQMGRVLGMEWLFVAWCPPEAYAGGWPALGSHLNQLGHRVLDAGFQFGYHNHSFEFTKIGGDYGLDLLFQNSSPVNVQAEVDVYWVAHGGADPAAYLQKMAGRVPLAHYKDMSEAEDRAFTEVGAGILDWDDIIESSRVAGVQYAIIENDMPQIDPLESVRLSREFLLAKGLTD